MVNHALGRATIGLLLVIGLGTPVPDRLGAQQPPPPPPPPMAPAPPPAVASGQELVDQLVAAFENMGQPDAGEMDETLADLADASRAANEQQSIDEAFFTRYMRVLMVLKLATLTDRGHVLAPVVDREFTAFVKDVTGKDYAASARVGGQIAVFSDAVASELASLGLEARRKGR